MQRLWKWPWALLFLSVACHPYGDSLQGEFNAGAVDPFNFPPAYRASSGSFTREIEGSGSFSERVGTAHNAPANYFYFPFPPSLVSTTGYATSSVKDPTFLSGLSIPSAFEFDPAGLGLTQADTSKCTAPDGYSYDPFRDDVHYDRQGNLLSALPNANYGVGALPSWSYVPVVAHVPVTSNGEACQSVKTDLTLLSRADVTVPLTAAGAPQSDGYVAWAVIDPGSPVFRVGQTAATSNGVTVQHYAWYRQFLAAYIDGGAIPTVDDASGKKKLVTQKLYFPRSGITKGAGLGAGNDLLQYQRGEAGYSPVCHIYSYTVPTGQSVPKDAATLEAAAAADPNWNLQEGAPVSSTGAITPTYAFCLQAQ